MNTKMTGILCILLTALVQPGARGESFDVWAVDPLVKVFQNDPTGTATSAEADAVRGEHVTFQLVARASAPVDVLRVSVTPFVQPSDQHTLSDASVRFVGYVHVDRPTQRPSSDQLREPPADYPDVLLEEESVAVAAGHAQPVWISLSVPMDCPEGAYHATARVVATIGGTEMAREIPLKIVVYPVTVDKTRLWVTNWFAMHWPHMDIDPAPESEEYYALLRRYARNMAEHSQNVALISPLHLTRYEAGDDGALRFDFSRFDRWVRLFQEEGVVGRIEGGHIGGRVEGWLSPFVATVHLVRDGAVVSERVPPDSEEAHTFYSAFFPALVEHLKTRGWLDIYMQHLADEPIAQNIESYRHLAALARNHAPELRIIEATHEKNLEGAIDIWVPQLNYLHEDYAHYQERQAAGDEVWYYTCVFPQGEYANRFIEQPLIKTRLLHWINFTYNITGYLHWGYNFWTGDDPVTHTTRPHGGPPYLPAGDPWIVYPGTDGPLDSIRFAAMRDGIVDHELLCRLREANPELARELAERHVLDFDRYDTDVERFRATRRALLEACAALP